MKPTNALVSFFIELISKMIGKLCGSIGSCWFWGRKRIHGFVYLIIMLLMKAIEKYRENIGQNRGEIPRQSQSQVRSKVVQRDVTPLEEHWMILDDINAKRMAAQKAKAGEGKQANCSTGPEDNYFEADEFDLEILRERDQKRRSVHKDIVGKSDPVDQHFEVDDHDMYEEEADW